MVKHRTSTRDDKIRKLKNKAWRLLSKKVRQERGNCCQRCGSTTNLNVHHIEAAKLNPGLFLDERNLLVLCVTCHKWGKWAFHQSFVEAYKLCKKLGLLDDGTIEYLDNKKQQDFQFTEKYLLNKIEEVSNGGTKKPCCKKNNANKRSR